MSRKDFNRKYRIGRKGKARCVRSDSYSKTKIVVWTGGQNVSDPHQCIIECNNSSYTHIATQNDWIKEIEIHYKIRCLNRSIKFDRNRRYTLSDKIFSIPSYTKGRPASQPTNNAHKLQCSTTSQKLQEVIKYELTSYQEGVSGEETTLHITTTVRR